MARQEVGGNPTAALAVVQTALETAAGNSPLDSNANASCNGELERLFRALPLHRLTDAEAAVLLERFRPGPDGTGAP